LRRPEPRRTTAGMRRGSTRSSSTSSRTSERQRTAEGTTMVSSSGSSSLPERALEAVRDPWVLLLAALGTGLAWAVGIDLWLALVVGIAMVATGTTLMAVLGGGGEQGSLKLA